MEFFDASLHFWRSIIRLSLTRVTVFLVIIVRHSFRLSKLIRLNYSKIPAIFSVLTQRVTELRARQRDLIGAGEILSLIFAWRKTSKVRKANSIEGHRIEIAFAFFPSDLKRALDQFQLVFMDVIKGNLIASELTFSRMHSSA
jgi:hypothetical protein